MFNGKSKSTEMQSGRAYSRQLEARLMTYVEGLLTALNQQIDRRLVVTFYSLLVALVQHRQLRQAAWPSELGSYLVPGSAQAGTKRIQKLQS